MAKMMSAEDVTQLLDLLKAADVQVWLDGGWGIDALVGEQTRAHKDLDLIVRDDHVRRMREGLVDRGFEHFRGPDWNFVLRDDAGREVDVHPVRIDEQGVGHLTTEAGEPFLYSADALAAVGTVNGRRARCLSADAQIVNHSDGDYQPGDTDFHDMRLLSGRLGTASRPAVHASMSRVAAVAVAAEPDSALHQVNEKLAFRLSSALLPRWVSCTRRYGLRPAKNHSGNLLHFESVVEAS